MKDESVVLEPECLELLIATVTDLQGSEDAFILHPSSFILHLLIRTALMKSASSPYAVL